MSKNCPLVGTVVLAAGSSSRLGQPKQLVEYAGQSLVRRTVEIAAKVTAGPIYVVTGSIHQPIVDSLKDSSASPLLEVVQCPHWSDGMGSSLAFAVTTLTKAFPELDAVLVLVCDQPHLNTPLLQEMLRLRGEEPRRPIAATYNGTVGTPACFSRDQFSALKKLSGDRGAQSLLKDPSNPCLKVSFPGGAIDLDTPEDLQSFINPPQTQHHLWTSRSKSMAIPTS